METKEPKESLYVRIPAQLMTRLHKARCVERRNLTVIVCEALEQYLPVGINEEVEKELA